MYDVAVIGAGVVGAAAARELSRFELKIAVLEKENDVSLGASKANSGIVHAGFDPAPGSLMAKLNARANKMFDALCGELSVPFDRNGALALAFDDGQLRHIEALKLRGAENGVSGLSLLSKEEVLKKEPAVSAEVKGALFAQSGGITDPMLLAVSLMENAVMNGARCLLNFEVASMEKENGAYTIKSLAGDSLRAKYVVNAAGVFADKIHNMAAPPQYKIAPRCGQYFMLDKTCGGIVRSVIFPCPSEIGKGILVVPSVHGNVMVGPASEDLTDKEDAGTTEAMLSQARAGARLLVPSLSAGNSIRTFSGLRAVSDTGDFIIKQADGAPNFIDVAGIKSPGLTAAPAIAEHVASILKEIGLPLNAKSGFNPEVKRALFTDMTEARQAALIKTNPLYGRVICRCENITEGDIVDSIKRSPGAVSLDGVKRRCRAGMGRCQGGFCAPKVQRILSRELGRPLADIALEKERSYILTGKTK